MRSTALRLRFGGHRFSRNFGILPTGKEPKTLPSSTTPTLVSAYFNGSSIFDKSLVVKSLEETPSKLVVLVRPRGFGKTSLLYLIKSFYSPSSQTDDETRQFFAASSLMKEYPNAASLFGSSPVLHIRFDPEANVSSLYDVDVSACEAFYNAFSEHSHVVYNLEKADPTSIFEAVRSRHLINALDKRRLVTYREVLLMVRALAAHFQSKVIVLIDDSDEMILKAHCLGVAKNLAVDFKALLHALKSEESVKKVVTAMSTIMYPVENYGIEKDEVYTLQQEQFGNDLAVNAKEIELLSKLVSKPGAPIKGGYFVPKNNLSEAAKVYDYTHVRSHFNMGEDGEIHLAYGERLTLAVAALSISENFEEQGRLLVQSDQPLRMPSEFHDFRVGLDVCNFIGGRDEEIFKYFFYRGYVTINPHRARGEAEIHIPNGAARRALEEAISLVRNAVKIRLESSAEVIFNGDADEAAAAVREFHRLAKTHPFELRHCSLLGSVKFVLAPIAKQKNYMLETAMYHNREICMFIPEHVWERAIVFRLFHTDVLAGIETANVKELDLEHLAQSIARGGIEQMINDEFHHTLRGRCSQVLLVSIAIARGDQCHVAAKIMDLPLVVNDGSGIDRYA